MIVFLTVIILLPPHRDTVRNTCMGLVVRGNLGTLPQPQLSGQPADTTLIIDISTNLCNLQSGRIIKFFIYVHREQFIKVTTPTGSRPVLMLSENIFDLPEECLVAVSVMLRQ